MTYKIKFGTDGWGRDIKYEIKQKAADLHSRRLKQHDLTWETLP